MDEITDFEELLDLNACFLCASQKSSQGLISDVLDKMCEAMGESNLATDNIFQSNKAINVVNDNNVDQTTLGVISVTECFGTDSTKDNETDDSRATASTTTYEQRNKNGETIPNYELVEFESILAAKCLGNNYNEPDDITTHNKKHMKSEGDESLADDDVVDLKEFEEILGLEFSNDKCMEYANKENDIGNTSSSNQYVKNELSSIYLDVFERFLETNKDCTKSSVEKKNKRMNNINTTSKARKFNENDATYLNQNVIEFDEFMSQDVKDRILTENKLNNSMTTIVPYEIPLEFEVDNKIRSETVTEQTHDQILNNEKCMNSDSEDGYNSLDFEFITEDDASKAGIITKTKITIDQNSNNGSVNTNLEISSTSIMSKNETGTLISRKNEASLSDYIKYSKYRYQRCYSGNYDVHHAIPEGEVYLDMFRGPNAPIVMNNLYTMRSKRVMPNVLMTVNHEDLIFRGSDVDENCEEHKGDAKESVNKILATYPWENRRKRRRH